MSALDQLQSDIIKDVSSGSLLVVTVGTEGTPATRNDMERICKIVEDVLEGIKGVRVLIVPHLIKVETLPMKTLRGIQSQIIKSWEDDDNESLIIGGIGDFGLLED